jgi:hypothetical protein
MGFWCITQIHFILPLCKHAFYIYYENLLAMFEDGLLKISYHVEVLDCLVEVSTCGKFCWVIIFGSHVDVIGKGHHILEGVNLHPHKLFYIK